MNIIAQTVLRLAAAAASSHGNKKPKKSPFDKSIEGKKFKNPKSGRMVKFESLPSEEQKKIRAVYSKHYKASGGSHPIAKKLFDGWHNQDPVQQHPKVGAWPVTKGGKYDDDGFGNTLRTFSTSRGMYSIVQGTGHELFFHPKGAETRMFLSTINGMNHARKLAGKHYDMLEKQKNRYMLDDQKKKPD